MLAREELFLLLDVQRLLFRGDGEVLLEALQLRAGALALALPLAQLLLGRARALLGDDPRVVRGAQLFFERLQLRGDAAGARFFAAEERFEIGDLALEREDARRRAFGLAADDERSADDVAFERDERRVRALLRAIERLGRAMPTMYASGIA